MGMKDHNERQHVTPWKLLPLALLATAVVAIQPPTTRDEALAAAAFSAPELRVEASLEVLAPGTEGALRQAGLEGFFSRYSAQWEVSVDQRSGRPHLIQGAGVPLLPGRGNDLRHEEVGLKRAKPTLAEVEARVRAFLASAPDLLQVAGFDLRLDTERSVAYGADAHFWNLDLQQYHGGVPVRDANVFFRINHGNIVQLGADRVAAVEIDPQPLLGAEEALSHGLGVVGFVDKLGTVADPGSLEIVPVLRVGEAPGERYAGEPGHGYDHRLVWSFVFAAEGADHGYRLQVDAHDGEVLEFVDLRLFADVEGDVYPVTNTDPLVKVGLPFTRVTDGGGSSCTNAGGTYTYGGGTATAQLDGCYIDINDNCGAASLSAGAPGDLDFGGVSGTNTDCLTPGFGGAGNTNAARTGFYHLTNINRKAESYFPGDAWLNGNLSANMNINSACNAYWSPTFGTVNFYRSGTYLGTFCSNTGEISAVFLHEWGHGMDQHSGGPASDQASGEAVGDTFAFLETQDACIGPNFVPGSPCYNCNASCTGVRDLAAFSATSGISTIARPDTVIDNTGIDCDRAWSCPYLGYAGPMGYQGHCESHIASTANWDLTQLLVGRYGTAGWSAMDDLWYGSLHPAQSAYRVAAGGQCNPNATVDGCGAKNWYTVYLAVDDNDGNLANGTPNACRIWDAFNAHGIACGKRRPCSADQSGCISPPSGLRGWWTLDEAFGPYAYELADGRTGLHVNGPTPVAGQVGGGLDFDGSDDYVNVNDCSNLDIGTADFTIDAWIRTTDTSGMIVAKRSYNSGIYTGYLFMVNNGRLLLQIADATSSWYNYTSSTMPTVNDGSWHLVAVSVDRDNPTGGRFYVDGSLVYTFNPTNRQGLLNNNSDLRIGRSIGGGSDHYFDGTIDEVEIFKRALSATEMQNLYNAGPAGKCKWAQLPTLPPCSEVSTQ